jgi:glycosyltransferase involved in cell wall biosynthesis
MCISNSRNSTGSDDPVEIDRIGRIVHVRIYHNVLWAHYKAAVFSSLYVEAGRDKVEVEFVHFAEVEANRRLGQIDVAEHKYPYRLLYQGAFESHSVLDRTIKGCADLLEFRGNCVVLPGYYDTSFWAMLVLAKMRGMKVIVCVDSTERDAERFWIREALKSLFFKLCDGAFCYGSQSRQYVAKLGLKPSQIFERCQATNNEELRRLFDVAQNEMPSRSRMWIGYVGRLSSEKNIDCLISAFASLIAEPQFGDWNLLIVGNGSERDRLVDLAAKAVPGRVRFEGGGCLGGKCLSI